MINKIKGLFLQLLYFKGCSKEFARSFCVGVYIAFSPFIGFHTAMVFLFSWLFALNFVILLAVSILINNPYTMVPVYGSGYLFGDWLLSVLPHWFFERWEWVDHLNIVLKQYVGISASTLGAFLLGGNLLGLLLAGILYPIVRYLKNCGSCLHS